MSLRNMHVNLPIEAGSPESLVEVLDKIDFIVRNLGGEANSRQVLASVTILLDRIEQLEKRLDANGIYQ